MNKLPIARTENLLVQNLDKEILIYDLLTNKAYCLNETSAIIYQACGSKTSFDALKRKYKFTDEIIFLALDELKENNLIAGNQYLVSPFTGMNRREIIRKVGLASMVALPVISSLIAPVAANAASGGSRGNNQSCTSDSQCASGVCTANSNFSLVCCVRTADSNFPLAPGGSFQRSSQSACASDAARFCCSGSATYSSAGSGTCTCN